MVKPVGVGKGHRLSEEMKQEIYDLYFNDIYQIAGVAKKLGIHRTTVRRHVKEMKEAR